MGTEGRLRAGHGRDLPSVERHALPAVLQYPGKPDTELAYGNQDVLPVAGEFGSLAGGDDPPPTVTSELDSAPRYEWGVVPPDVAN